MLLALLAIGCTPILTDGTYDTQLERLAGERVDEVDGSEDADHIDANTVPVADCALAITTHWNDVEIAATDDGYAVDTVEKDDDFELVADGVQVSGVQDTGQSDVNGCVFEMAPELDGEVLSSTEMELSREVFLTEVSGECGWIDLPCSWEEEWLLVLK